MPKLKNPRHEKVAQARALGKTLEDCAKAAGYAEHASSISTILSLPNVSERVGELQDEALKVTTKTLEDGVHELEKLAFSSLGKFYKLGEDGLPEVSFEAVDADDACALADLTVDDVTVGSKLVRRVRLKLADKAGALVKFIDLKTKQREREEAQAALDAKTIDGTVVRDDRQDYLNDLAERFRLPSLEKVKAAKKSGDWSALTGHANGKTNGNDSGSSS